MQFRRLERLVSSRLQRALLLVSTKNRDLWEGPTPELRDSRTSRHSAHAQSQAWQTWLAENTKRLLCTCSENWTFPEVAILGAGQKEPEGHLRPVMILINYFFRSNQNMAYSLNTGSEKTSVYCHMTSLDACGGGGWTLVIKMNGSQV